MLACRVVLSSPLTDWRISGSGKVEETFACGINLCGADDRLKLGAESGATSTGGANGVGVRLELGAEDGATSTGGDNGFGVRLELGAEGGATSSGGASGFGAVWASAAPGIIRAAAKQAPVKSITRAERAPSFRVFNICSPWRRRLGASRYNID